MRLLERSDAGEFSVTEYFVNNDEIPPYAILSHTWVAGEEVILEGLRNGTGKGKSGYDKIRFCGEQARRDGLQYFWVDTCCIDKSNNVELQEAINSMFRWYQKAATCYVYLSDVSIAKRKASDHSSEFVWEPAFRESRWFTRGWTLQKLLAPGSVKFFSREGKQLGDKKTLERQIHEITGIAIPALQGIPLSQFEVRERLSWAESRQTTCKEDKAYSLLGIFDVFMPLIYGEGRDNAFKRLREEIDKPLKGCLQQQALVQMVTKDQEREELLAAVLQWLDPLPVVDSYHDILHAMSPGSCEWILKKQEYVKWIQYGRNCKQQQILWVSGIPGAGKTRLATAMIRRLREDGKKVAYFYCDSNDAERQNILGVLKTWAWQLIQMDVAQLDKIANIMKKGAPPNETNMTESLGILLYPLLAACSCWTHSTNARQIL